MFAVFILCQEMSSICTIGNSTSSFYLHRREVVKGTKKTELINAGCADVAASFSCSWVNSWFRGYNFLFPYPHIWKEINEILHKTAMIKTWLQYLCIQLKKKIDFLQKSDLFECLGIVKILGQKVNKVNEHLK